MLWVYFYSGTQSVAMEQLATYWFKKSREAECTEFYLLSPIEYEDVPRVLVQALPSIKGKLYYEINRY